MSQTHTPTPDKQDNNLTLILIAVALGIVTVVLTNIYIINVRKQVEGETETVYRLKQSYDESDKLRKQDLTAVRMRKEAVAEHGKYITAVDLDAWLGEPVLRPVRQGEYLTWDIFTSTSEGADMRITPGMRACPIPVAAEGRPGSLDPGAIVDIYAPVIKPGQPPQAMLVIEKVRVIMVGSRAIGESGRSGGSSNYNTVTLEVPPDVVQQLFTIQQWLGRAEFLLSPRNPGDNSVQIIDGGVNRELLKLVEAAQDTDSRRRFR